MRFSLVTCNYTFVEYGILMKQKKKRKSSLESMTHPLDILFFGLIYKILSNLCTMIN